MPVSVIVSGDALLSTKRFAWHVKSCVPLTAVKGVVGGANAPVYIVALFTTRTFDMYPVNAPAPPPDPPAMVTVDPVNVGFQVVVTTETPF